MYIVVALLLFAVFAYFATWIDDKADLDCLPGTILLGVIACVFWPFTLGIAMISVPFYFLVLWGGKRRGDIL